MTNGELNILPVIFKCLFYQIKLFVKKIIHQNWHTLSETVGQQHINLKSIILPHISIYA